MTSDIRDMIIDMLPRLRKFALALTGCPDRGEDLVQETCLRALDRAHQWQPGTRLDSWLFRIAQNHWIDTMRAGAKFAGTPPDEENIPDNGSQSMSAADRHEHYAVRRAVSELPSDQRVLIALICISGYGYREASEILGIPIGTVMSRLARARRTLHAALYGVENEPERSMR